MIAKLVRGIARRLDVAPWLAPAVAALATLATLLSPAPAAAQGAMYNHGLRWLGRAKQACAPLRDWTAVRPFTTPGLPPALTELCLYSWIPAGRTPQDADVVALAAASGAQELTEDVPVVYPSSPRAAAESQLSAGLRAALRAHVGDASLLAAMPDRPRVRVAVIDSAPDAPAGAIRPGLDRHGDTLAHLIEDLVCLPVRDPLVARRCAAEVTTVLALPWIDRRVAGPDGGHLGTLADIARAIDRAVARWQSDRRADPGRAPARLILNLSLGWEHTAGIADCTADRSAPLGLPARTVRAILQHAAAQGVLAIAAAGNDSGGPEPRTQLICPGRFQAIPQAASPAQALLVAVSGVDYQDRPLETVRPAGVTGIAALGLGGIAWAPADPIPPPLTGSSVSTAVVAAVSALVWSEHPAWSPGDVTRAVYAGGVDVGGADACPMLLATCRSRRASVCGALTAAGGAPACSPAAPNAWSCPALPGPITTLAAAYTGVTPSAATPVALAMIPRNLAPTIAVLPYAFPTPISVGCRACAMAAVMPGQPQLYLPERGQDLQSPVLVVTLTSGHVEAVALGPLLDASTAYVFPLPPGWIVESAFLTGFGPTGDSVTEQIFVQP